MTIVKPRLRVVAQDLASPSGLGAAVGVAQKVASPVRRNAAGRPWDQLAPWWLPECPSSTRLFKAAAARGLIVDVAASVTIERSLAISELAQIAPALIVELDSLALRARPRRVVGGGAATYLRQLTAGRSASGRCASRLGPVSLPGRVCVRLASVSDDEVADLLAGDLDAAVRWERASLLEGRTIAEWATSQALVLVRG